MDSRRLAEMFGLFSADRLQKVGVAARITISRRAATRCGDRCIRYGCGVACAYFDSCVGELTKGARMKRQIRNGGETQGTRDLPRNTVLTGDALVTLRTLPAGSVDCVVTSPP